MLDANQSTGFDPVPSSTDGVASSIVDSALKVHTQLGPGLLESVYEVCLARELEKRGLEIRRQCILPVVYDGVVLDAAFRVDLIVDSAVIVEVKAVETILAVHQSQILSYLRLSGLRLGLLLNFNVPRLREGIRRVVV